MQKVDLPTSFTKLNENCGLPDIFTDYQIRHLGNPSGLPEILLKIDPWTCGCSNNTIFQNELFSRFLLSTYAEALVMMRNSQDGDTDEFNSFLV